MNVFRASFLVRRRLCSTRRLCGIDESVDELVGALIHGKTATRDVQSHMDIPVTFSQSGKKFSDVLSDILRQRFEVKFRRS